MSKRKNINLLLSLVSLSALTTLPVYASEQHYTVAVPHCLVKNLQADYQTLATLDQLALISMNETNFNQLLKAKEHQTKVCGGFMNVTDAWNTYQKQSNFTAVNAKNFLRQYTIPTIRQSKKTPTYAIKYTKEVNQLLNELHPNAMWDNLKTLSSYKDRYADSDTGVSAANWIRETVLQIAKDNGRTDVSSFLVQTGNRYKQPSVVIKMGTSNEPGIVVSGHMDTNQAWFGNMPGADDDGSGSMSTLEVARTLLSSNMHFKNPIYFIWYSAEEEGLVGSQYVVSQFKKQNIPVANVFHLDMTGYTPKNDPTLWLIQDNTNPALTSYLETLIKTYVKQPVQYTACGYACSDHASWTQKGYVAAMATEAKFGLEDPYLHTAQDKMELLSVDHMLDFAKLGVAFVVELAEPISN
jgi:leucyl aminopeptidase